MLSGFKWPTFILDRWVLVFSTCKFSTVVIKLAKSVFDARIDVSMPVAPFNAAFVA